MFLKHFILTFLFISTYNLSYSRNFNLDSLIFNEVKFSINTKGSIGKPFFFKKKLLDYNISNEKQKYSYKYSIGINLDIKKLHFGVGFVETNEKINFSYLDYKKIELNRNYSNIYFEGGYMFKIINFSNNNKITFSPIMSVYLMSYNPWTLTYFDPISNQKIIQKQNKTPNYNDLNSFYIGKERSMIYKITGNRPIEFKILVNYKFKRNLFELGFCRFFQSNRNMIATIDNNFAYKFNYYSFSYGFLFF